MTTPTVPYIDRTVHVDGDDYTGPHLERQPLPSFDMRTSPERLVMWCANLEIRLEGQDRRIAHLELAVHRLLNAQGAQP